MKILKLFVIIFLFSVGFQFPTMANQGFDKSTETALKGVDAKTALKIANQWRWSRGDIKSYINTREVVVKFPNGKTTKILLPENEVMIAVAPYLNKTHE
jgi:hypothetical protein